MATRCKVCLSEKVNEINRLLVRGVRPQDVAQTFNLGYATIHHHMKAHVPKMLALAHTEKLSLEADTLATEAVKLYASAVGLLAEVTAELRTRIQATSKDRAYIMAVSALRECGRLLELMGSLAEKLPKPQETVTIRVVDQSWHPCDSFGDITQGPPGRRPLLPAPAPGEGGRAGGGEPGGEDER
jgi:hypothetical protein